MIDGEKYLELLTSEHRGKPKFEAMILGLVSVPVQVQNLLLSFSTIFDLDLPPVGNQLDIIGKWVGVSRDIRIPISGVYFTWEGADLLGWDFGSWQDPNQPTSINSLPDDAYLLLIRAKIAANHWDGTTEGAYTIWESIFPTLNILIQDYQDMSYTLVIVGGIVDSLTMALLTGGYLPLKPEGVRINEYIVAVDTNPMFGWDIENSFIQGWETGSWGLELAPV